MEEKNLDSKGKKKEKNLYKTREPLKILLIYVIEKNTISFTARI